MDKLRWAVLVVVAVVAGCGQSDTVRNSERALEAAQIFLIEQDFKRWPEFYQPEAELNGSTLALTIMRGTAQGIHHSFPDVQLKLVEQIATGDQVVTRFLLEGTHDGYFSNLKPTHRRVSFNGIVVDDFRDGRIQRSFMLLDLYGLSRDLATAAQ